MCYISARLVQKLYCTLINLEFSTLWNLLPLEILFLDWSFDVWLIIPKVNTNVWKLSPLFILTILWCLFPLFSIFHMLVLALIDNWVLVISVHSVTFSWYVRKSVFCNIYPVCILLALLFVDTHLCVIRAHFGSSGNRRKLFYSIEVFISWNFIKWQCSLIVNCELLSALEIVQFEVVFALY